MNSTRVTAILLVSVALLALGSPLTKLLVRDGGKLGLVAPESISFCNVLFVGNLCAAGVVLAFFGARKVVGEIRAMPRRAWLPMAASILFAAAIPSLIFTALTTTTVTNAILLGRFESIAFALLGGLFGATLPPRAALAGYAVILVGIVTLALVQGMGHLAIGDGYVMLAALLQALAAHVAKRTLEHTTVGAFVALRNGASALIFFVIAVVLYGFEHFQHAFRPGLWPVMLAYALVAIVLAQVGWYSAICRAPGERVAGISLLSPFFGVFFAWLLVGENPSAAQWTGGAIIAVGMAIARRGKPRTLVGESVTGGLPTLGEGDDAESPTSESAS